MTHKLFLYDQDRQPLEGGKPIATTVLPERGDRMLLGGDGQTREVSGRQFRVAGDQVQSVDLYLSEPVDGSTGFFADYR